MNQQAKDWGTIIGKNIRRIRMYHKETQAELGKIIGYGATTVANYESGVRLPDLITAHTIAMHYQVQMDELFLESLHES